MIKKFFDKYVFSNLGMQIVVSLTIIFLFAIMSNFCRGVLTQSSNAGYFHNLVWGFKQVSSPTAAINSIEQLDNLRPLATTQTATPLMFLISILAWIIALVVYSFVTGAIVNSFRNRKQKIVSGYVRYKLKNHGIVVGWDFQGVASVLALLNEFNLKEVVIISELPSNKIRDELSKELTKKQMRRVYVYYGSIQSNDEIKTLYVYHSRVVIILGDHNDSNNDGGNIVVSEMITKAISKYHRKKLSKRNTKEKEIKEGSTFQRVFNKGTKNIDGEVKNKRIIDIFVDISSCYNLLSSEYNAYDYLIKDEVIINIQIMNFYRETVLGLFSSFSSIQKYNNGPNEEAYETPYYPLKFLNRPNINHIHLLISGFNETAKAIILNTIPLMPDYGEKNKITIYSTDKQEFQVFSVFFALENLHNIEVEYVPSEISSPEVNEELKKIIIDPTACTTLFVCENNPDKAHGVFNRLPKICRNESLRILIEQRLMSKWVRKISEHNFLGYAKVSYFGFLDGFYTALKNTCDLRKEYYNKNLSKLQLSIKEEYFKLSFVNNMLPFINYAGLSFDYNYEKKYSLESVVEAQIEAKKDKLVAAEHYRNYNFRILHGDEYDKKSDNFLFYSSDLTDWNGTTEEYKTSCKKNIETLFDLVNKLYNNPQHEYPYRVTKKMIKRSIGISPLCSSYDLQNSEKFRKKIIEIFKEQNKKAVYFKKDGVTPKTQTSCAVLFIPNLGVTYDIFWTAYTMGIELIAILPEPVEEYLGRFKDEKDRMKISQIMRNVYDYYVVPGASSYEEKLDYIKKFIQNCSNVYFKTAGENVSKFEIKPLERENKHFYSLLNRNIEESYIVEINGDNQFNIS